MAWGLEFGVSGPAPPSFPHYLKHESWNSQPKHCENPSLDPKIPKTLNPQTLNR